MREIDSIIIHCSDSISGNAIIIDEWHRERGFNEIGYHYVILNGNPQRANVLVDGFIETGRDISKEGAHCLGHNERSIGVCLIGKSGHFTPKQYKSLVFLIKSLKASYNGINVFMHSDLDPINKPLCPGIDVATLLEFMADEQK